ncbi:hypothetical protein HYFRA_00012401 [Hymenoscyphus fraxineus]|uniref:Uncharacterized protein n=1 Tax=Hymenoscyphus fraxineus TaxID=746836 RepID=A0A9N9LBA0_9HELO|nr:hypothetical protein HYFRA_00012401 [Hymenoscyphus fraxineus]
MMNHPSGQAFAYVEQHTHQMPEYDGMPARAPPTMTSTAPTPTLQDLYEALYDTPEFNVAQMFQERFKQEDDPDVEELYQWYLQNGNKPMKKLVFVEKGGYPKAGRVDPNANWGIYQRMHGNPENHRRYPLDHIPFPPRGMEVKWVAPGDPAYPADPEHTATFRQQRTAAESATAPLSPQIPEHMRSQLSQVHELAATFHDGDDRTFFPAAALQPTTPQAINLTHERGFTSAQKDLKTIQEEAYKAAAGKREAQSLYNPYATPGSSSYGQKYPSHSPSVLAYIHNQQSSATSSPTVNRSMQKAASQIARDIGAQLTTNVKPEMPAHFHHGQSASNQLRPDSPSFNMQQPRKASNESQSSVPTPNLGKGNHSHELLEILRQTSSGASATPQPKVNHAHRPSSQPDLMDTIRGNTGLSLLQQHELRLQQAAAERERFNASAGHANNTFNFRQAPSRHQTHSQQFSGASVSFGSSTGSSSAYLQSLQQNPSYYQPNQASTTRPHGHFRTASARPSDAKQVPMTHEASTQATAQAEMSSSAGHATTGQAKPSSSFNPGNFNASNIDFSFKPF